MARVGAQPQADLANAALAQLVEHIIRNDGVVGSSPPSGTTFLMYFHKQIQSLPCEGLPLWWRSFASWTHFIPQAFDCRANDRSDLSLKTNGLQRLWPQTFPTGLCTVFRKLSATTC